MVDAGEIPRDDGQVRHRIRDDVESRRLRFRLRWYPKGERRRAAQQRIRGKTGER